MAATSPLQLRVERLELYNALIVVVFLAQSFAYIELAYRRTSVPLAPQAGNTTIVNHTTTLPVTHKSVPVLHGDGGERYGGISGCLTLPGLRLPNYHEQAMDQIDTLCPAVNTIGTLLASNAAVFLNDIYLKCPGQDDFESLCWHRAFERNETTGYCGACVHGRASRVDCHCACYPNWSGDFCDVSLCSGKGTWNATSKTCRCSDNLDPAVECARPLPNSPSPPPACPLGVNQQAQCSGPDNGVCIDGECYCGRGLVGKTCSYMCAGPDISELVCPGRHNWGWDWHGVLEQQDVFVCGMGYSFNDPNLVHIASMTCGGALPDGLTCQQLWEQESRVCCAPDARCHNLRHAFCDRDDSECCSLFATEGVCHSAGCLWTSGVCVDVGSSDNPNNPDIELVRGQWVIFTFDCTEENSFSICDRATRTQYLQIYMDECGTRPFSESCLASARTRVNEAAWPRLSTSYVYSTNFPYRLAGVHARSDCTAYLGISTNHRNRDGALAEWSCTGTSLYLEDSQKGYQIIALQPEGRYCLVAENRDTTQVATDLFQLQEQDTPNPLVYWRQLRQSPSIYLDANYYCSTFSLAVGQPSVLAAIDKTHLVTYATAGVLPIVAKAHTDIPLTPAASTCGPCTTIDGCSADDTLCLQEMYSTIDWPTCCGCLWGYTRYRGSCQPT